MKRWPLQEAWFWERAPFFRLLLPLIAGILLYDNIIPSLNYTPILTVAIIAGISFAIVSLFPSQTKTFRHLRFGTLHVALIAATWLLSYHNDIRNNEKWFAANKSRAYVARITSPPIEKEKTWKLKTEVIGTRDGTGKTIGDAFVYVYKNKLPLLLSQGDTIILPAKWQPVQTSGNPFEFDYVAYCNRNNIYYQQFLASDELVLYNTASRKDIPWVQRLHNKTVDILQQYIKDNKVAGLMQAMLVGEEANLDTDIRQAYSDTGIIHIIAISGSHITFFFLVITFALRWIKHKKWKWIKYIAAIPLVWLYVAMSGAPPSAVRAAMMFSILGIGFALDKQSYSLNHLFATAFILLCAEPMWLYAIGFQLSFVAVLSLILFYRPIYKLYTPANSIVRPLWQVVAASLAAEVLVAPLVVYYFHLFPLMFIIANVAAYLFMGIALIGGMLLVACSTIPPIATAIGAVITYIVSVFNRWVYALQEFNPPSFSFLQVSMAELLLLYLIIAGVAVYVLRQKKAGLYVAIISTIIFLISLNINEWYALHQQRLIVYNMGKANHIELIQGKQYSILSTDTSLSNGKKNYVLKPTHTGYHAWRSSNTYNKDIVYLNNQSVLILHKNPATNNPFHVDCVIINYKADAGDLQHIKTTFSPKQVVVGNNLPRSQTDVFINQAQVHGINLWIVSRNGAFVL